MLEDIFKKQKEYEAMLNLSISPEERIKQISMAIHVEASELLNTTRWKWWKKRAKWSPDFAFDELIDLLHFTISGCLAIGMNANELHKGYLKKNGINRRRQEEGY
jgi:dimeric dUTPase (all-alpha-NTP-PPase superfamily)